MLRFSKKDAATPAERRAAAVVAPKSAHVFFWVVIAPQTKKSLKPVEILDPSVARSSQMSVDILDTCAARSGKHITTLSPTAARIHN